MASEERRARPPQAETTKDRMEDRSGWIRRRAAHGHDWTDLMLALSGLVIHSTEEGLAVDASAIADVHSPSQYLLEPGPDGMWVHKLSGSVGPLVELLMTFCLYHVEREKPYHMPEAPGGEPGGGGR